MENDFRNVLKTSCLAIYSRTGRVHEYKIKTRVHSLLGEMFASTYLAIVFIKIYRKSSPVTNCAQEGWIFIYNRPGKRRGHNCATVSMLILEDMVFKQRSGLILNLHLSNKTQQ